MIVSRLDGRFDHGLPVGGKTLGGGMTSPELNNQFGNLVWIKSHFNPWRMIPLLFNNGQIIISSSTAWFIDFVYQNLHFLIEIRRYTFSATFLLFILTTGLPKSAGFVSSDLRRRDASPLWPEQRDTRSPKLLLPWRYPVRHVFLH